MKKILYLIVSVLTITCLYSCELIFDPIESFYMDEIKMNIVLYKRGYNKAISFCDSGESNWNNYIKFSTIEDMPPMRIFINRSDSIIYLYKINSKIKEINITDFKVVEIHPQNYKYYIECDRGVFFGDDSIIFSDLNNPEKRMVLFEIWPHVKTINKWYSKPGWHIMDTILIKGGSIN